MLKNTTPIEVGESDLPLHCPMNQNLVWNLHPKVFLDIAHTGEAKCPYCGTSYLLKAGVKVGH
jgi:uncharacterized Zn-finger protein